LSFKLGKQFSQTIHFVPSHQNHKGKPGTSISSCTTQYSKLAIANLLNDPWSK